MKFIKFLLIFFSLLALTTSIIGCTSNEERRKQFISKINDISEEEHNKLIDEVQKDDGNNNINTQKIENDDKTIDTKNDVIKVRDQQEMWRTIHKMANTKIIADEIRGRIEITEELVDELIIEVNATNYHDKKKLLNILNNWKDKDFSNVVDEYNYVWSMLEGEVGWAVGEK